MIILFVRVEKYLERFSVDIWVDSLGGYFLREISIERRSFELGRWW